MRIVHSFLDRSSVPTWKYERAVRVAMETILLVACAAPVVTGWRSLLAQIIVGALRLHQAEVGREKASIIGRAYEHRLLPALDLPTAKRNLIHAIEKREAIIAWVWPVLVPLVAAAETNAWTLVLVVGIVATIVRIWFDKWVTPNWRTNRVDWRKANLVQCVVVEEQTDRELTRMHPDARAAFDRAQEREKWRRSYERGSF
jgi:hypothetical protein